jgi:hypothetical protein
VGRGVIGQGHLAYAAIPPAAKRIFIRQVKEGSEQLTLLRQGDIDIARNLDSDQLRSIVYDASLHKLSTPTTQQLYIAGNEAYEAFSKTGGATGAEMGNQL